MKNAGSAGFITCSSLGFRWEVVTVILSGTWVHQKLLQLRAMAHICPPEKYNDNFGKVRIDNVSIGSGLYTVTFLFNSSDRLVQTNVASNEKKNEGIVARQLAPWINCWPKSIGKPEFSDSNKATETSWHHGWVKSDGHFWDYGTDNYSVHSNSRVASDTTDLLAYTFLADVRLSPNNQPCQYERW